MLIIGNNCVSARIYEQTNLVYNNPFMWSAIRIKDYVNLVDRFEQLKFENSVFGLEKFNKNTDTKSVLCNIDDIMIHYMHYLYNELVDGVTIEKPNVYSKNIVKYAQEKFYNRLSRMKELNENPVFLWVGNKPSDFEVSSNLKEIQKSKKKYVVVISDTVNDINLKNCTLFKIPKHVILTSTTEIAKYLLNNNDFKKAIQL